MWYRFAPRGFGWGSWGRWLWRCYGTRIRCHLFCITPGIIDLTGRTMRRPRAHALFTRVKSWQFGMQKHSVMPCLESMSSLRQTTVWELSCQVGWMLGQRLWRCPNIQPTWYYWYFGLPELQVVNTFIVNLSLLRWTSRNVTQFVCYLPQQTPRIRSSNGRRWRPLGTTWIFITGL